MKSQFIDLLVSVRWLGTGLGALGDTSVPSSLLVSTRGGESTSAAILLAPVAIVTIVHMTIM